MLVNLHLQIFLVRNWSRVLLNHSDRQLVILMVNLQVFLIIDQLIWVKFLLCQNPSNRCFLFFIWDIILSSILISHASIIVIVSSSLFSVIEYPILSSESSIHIFLTSHPANRGVSSYFLPYVLILQINTIVQLLSHIHILLCTSSQVMYSVHSELFVSLIQKLLTQKLFFSWFHASNVCQASIFQHRILLSVIWVPCM